MQSPLCSTMTATAVVADTVAVAANDQRWRERAVCDPVNGHDPNAWFPPSVRQHSKRAEALAAMAVRLQRETEAKALCATCPVWQECLEYAIDNDVRDGIWGGRTPVERGIKRRR